MLSGFQCTCWGASEALSRWKRYPPGCGGTGGCRASTDGRRLLCSPCSLLSGAPAWVRGLRSRMLLELRAENYAVIDRADVRLGAGLNLLTGETGAGKSILIDALALLLGGKASGDMVRHGSEKAVIACTFEDDPWSDGGARGKRDRRRRGDRRGAASARGYGCRQGARLYQ